MNQSKGLNLLYSSSIYKLFILFRQKMFRMFDNSVFGAYAGSGGRKLIRYLRLLADECAAISRFSSLLRENSLVKKILWKIRLALLRAHLSTGLYWQGILEGLILLLILFMPVLNWWWYLLPLLVLLFLTSSRESGASVNGGKVFLSGTGLWLFGTVLMISAVFSGGFKTGIINLLQWSTWICIAGMVYLTFSQEFCKKVLKYNALTSLIWLAAGYGQLYAGLPTPAGWLGAGQNAVINLRIYSVFGNPNIYALYLLSILTLSGFFIDTRTSGQSRRVKYCWVLIAGLTLTALYFTYSRTAWLIAGVLLFRWTWRSSGSERLQWIIFLSLLIFAVLSTLPGFRARIGSLADSSFWYRVRIWKGVIKALKDFWIWGSGPGKFPVVYPAYQIGDTPSQHAHQLYLQIWLENGLFSLMAFGRVIMEMFSRLRFSKEPYLGPLVLVLMVFLVYGFVETWWMNSFLGGYFWLLAGLLKSLQYKEPEIP